MRTIDTNDINADWIRAVGGQRTIKQIQKDNANKPDEEFNEIVTPLKEQSSDAAKDGSNA